MHVGVLDVEDCNIVRAQDEDDTWWEPLCRDGVGAGCMRCVLQCQTLTGGSEHALVGVRHERPVGLRSGFRPMGCFTGQCAISVPCGLGRASTESGAWQTDRTQRSPYTKTQPDRDGCTTPQARHALGSSCDVLQRHTPSTAAHVRLARVAQPCLSKIDTVVACAQSQSAHELLHTRV